MTRSKDNIMDDLFKMGEVAIGLLSDVKHGVKAEAKGGIERVISRLDLVTREEFDAAFEMLSLLRTEQESLAKRLDALEEKKHPNQPATAKSAQAKSGKAKSGKAKGGKGKPGKAKSPMPRGKRLKGGKKGR